MFKFNKNYKDLEQVTAFFEEFKKEYDRIKEQGERPYNASFRGKIKGLEGESENTGIFLLQELMERKKEEEHRKKMIKEGYIELTEKVIEQAIAEKKKIELVATATNDWRTIRVNEVFKPSFFNGKYGLMKPRARSRGYSPHQFENAYCRLV